MDIEKYNPKSGRMLKEDNTTVNIAALIETIANAINPSGGLDVNIQDQTTEIIDLHLSRVIQSIDIAINTAIDDLTVNIDAASAPTIGNIACFKEGSAFYQGEILGVTDNGGGNYDIDLDTPLDYAYTTAGGCSERSINLAVDGSTTPVVFSVSPANLTAGIKWDIVRVMGQIIDATAMDDGKFGGMTALTKGIVFRTTDGITKNIFTAKSNGDLAAHMYDVSYVDATQGPSGNYAIRWRRTFGGPSKNGVVARLCADTSDEFQIIVQDDLTDLINFQAIVQGHVVD